MAAKIAFVFIVAFLVFQLLTWQSDATVIRRDVTSTTTKPSDAGQTIDEALQSFKTGLDDMVKNIQNNELFQNVSQSLKDFGEQIQNHGQKLVEKIQTSAKSTN